MSTGAQHDKKALSAKLSGLDNMQALEAAVRELCGSFGTIASLHSVVRKVPPDPRAHFFVKLDSMESQTSMMLKLGLASFGDTALISVDLPPDFR